MRSRPATWTACLAEYSVGPIPRTRHGGVHRLRLLKEHSQRMHSSDCVGGANSAKQSAALRWPTASPAVCGGLCEEAATPGQPFPYRSTLWRTLPIIHPRELPGTAGSAAMLWQGPQNISLQCQHCAPYADSLQEEISDAMCRNCGWQRFFVESTGKNGRNSRALPELSWILFAKLTDAGAAARFRALADADSVWLRTLDSAQMLLSSWVSDFPSTQNRKATTKGTKVARRLSIVSLRATSCPLWLRFSLGDPTAQPRENR